MSTPELGRRERLARWVPKINAVAFVLLAVVAIGLIDAARTNRAQDDALSAARAQQLQQNTALLECVDRYMTQTSDGQPEVRRATKRRDDAMGRAFIALQTVLALRATDNLGSRDLRDAVAALQEYRVAAAALDRAVLANPVPVPPSRACRSVSPAAGG